MAKPLSPKAKDLRAALAHMPTSPSAPAEVSSPTAASRPARAAAAPKAKFQLYFHPEDTRRMRELAAWLASQGVRITDSLVIRSALRAVEMDSKLLAACQEAAKLDQRFKKRAA